MAFIKITDEVKFIPLSVKDAQQAKDNFSVFAGTNQGSKKSLILDIAATHSGLITRNNGFYLPEKMRTGAASFTAQYNKPIQLHHDGTRDPIGRVIAAEYVDTSNRAIAQIVNSLKNRNYQEQTIKDFCSGKLPYLQSVNLVCDGFTDEASILDDPSYQGLGYIKLTAEISDPDAIQKFLDGRYLTGSVGATTNHAVCSVCRADWVTDDLCEHRPGKKYDGKKAYVIAGDLNYDEYSVANTPADRHSRVIQIHEGGTIQNSIEMDNSFGRIMDSAIEIRDSANNSQETIKMDETIESTFTDKEKLSVVLKTLYGFEDEVITKLLSVEYKDAAEMKDAADKEEWTSYSELEDEAVNTYKVEHPEDATLSTAQRKRLPSSAFCGPNRSFPVSDSASLESARRLATVATMSDSGKEKVMENISRKEKAFGPASVVTQDKVVESTEPVSLHFADGKGTITLSNTILKIVEDTKVIFEGTIESLNVTDTVTSLNETIKALQDKSAELATQLVNSTNAQAKAEKDLEDVRSEYQLTHNDLTTITDQLVEAKELYLDVLIDKICLFNDLTGKTPEKVEEFRTGLKESGEKVIKDTLLTLAATVDLEKIKDRINTGVSKEQVNLVEDPTIPVQDNKDSNQFTKFKNEYERIHFGGISTWGSGPKAAKQYLNYLLRNQRISYDQVNNITAK